MDDPNDKFDSAVEAALSYYRQRQIDRIDRVNRMVESLSIHLQRYTKAKQDKPTKINWKLEGF